MFDRYHPAKQARGFARVAGFSAASIMGPALALACALLAGCAAPGAGPSPMAADQTSPSKADPAARPGGGVETKTIASDSNSVQRRRQAIADMIEERTSYVSRWVEGGAARLTDAQFAGPFEYTRKDLFTAPVTETVYCAKVDAHYFYFPTPYPYEAVIQVAKVDAITERVHADIFERGSPRECRDAPYGPFPELEQARGKRRKAQGRPD